MRRRPLEGATRFRLTQDLSHEGVSVEEYTKLPDAPRAKKLSQRPRGRFAPAESIEPMENE